MQWSLIETFIRVAQHGSLSSAAKTLHISQPTLSRQVQALEEELGFPVFVRHARGLSLTDRGQALLARAEQLDGEVQQLLLQAKGLRQDPAGVVRISASEPIAVFALPKPIATLRRMHPKIDIELVVDNSPANLSRREADVAVRMFRPEQLDLVCKKVSSIEMGLFGSAEYVAHHGAPKDLQDARGHTLIGFDRDSSWLETIRRFGLKEKDFRFRCDSMVAHLEAMRAGVGLGAIHLSLARRFPELLRVIPELTFADTGIWLVVHADVQKNPAIRVVLEALERGLIDYADLPE
jgi:DNA-binding transcriptional LysR family regulator